MVECSMGSFVNAENIVLKFYLYCDLIVVKNIVFLKCKFQTFRSANS